MNLRRITIFLTVAKHLSYTKAAEELYISQPAITKNIQALEQIFGVRLFNRKGSGIELTTAGELAYSYSNEIDKLLQNLTYEIDLLSNKQTGNLRIGASSTIAQYLIPSVIAGFKKCHPEVTISLISGNTSEINTNLDNELIDVGITEGHRRLINFDYIPYRNDEIAFMSHVSSPISVPETLTKENLVELPLVIRETGSGTREVFEKALKQAGITLSDVNILISLGSTESIKSFLPNTKAVGVFSINAIRKSERSSFTISHLNKHVIHREFQFIVKQGAVHKLAKEFIRFCKQHHNFSL